MINLASEQPANSPKKLRFAALIRVSTEQQEKEGESLRTQRSDNEETVARLGGTVVAWYGGQEHATPGHEKKEMDRLLRDASITPKLFDAIVVAHADRWSRDNAKSREGIEVLKKYGIRFFVGEMEYDLFYPLHEFLLTMSAAVGQFQARQQNLVSIRNRIKRAKNGIPTCGKLPFGRLKDPGTGRLRVDPVKQQIIQDVARRYLDGERLPDLAREYRMNHSNLHKILTKRSGTDWQIDFCSESANVRETVKLEIPALLDADTITAVQKRVAANRTYAHGTQRNGRKYLLSRVIFCAHCGYAMFGQLNHDERRYYRHHHNRDRRRPCPGPAEKSWLHADVIEDLILRHLFECFGNPKAVKRAIEEATPNLEKTRDMTARAERLSLSLAKLERSRQRVLQLVERDDFSEEDVRSQLTRIKEQETVQKAELAKLEVEISQRPTPGSIKTASLRVAQHFAAASKYQFSNPKLVAKTQIANTHFCAMSWDEKRALIQMVFSGHRADGQRMGVYIEWIESPGKRGQWKYSIHGHLIDEVGWLPMSEEGKEAYFAFGAAHLQKALVTKSASD